MRRKEKEFKSPLTAFQLLERIIVKDSVQLLDIANLLKNGKMTAGDINNHFEKIENRLNERKFKHKNAQ